MSITTSLSQQKELIEFAERAAKNFALNPNNATYGSSFPSPGEYLAIRWGMGDDGVLVVKLDENFTPINFQQAVREI